LSVSYYTGHFAVQKTGVSKTNQKCAGIYLISTGHAEDTFKLGLGMTHDLDLLNIGAFVSPGKFHCESLRCGGWHCPPSA